VIDSEGYTPNVGIILCNTENKVLWARRIGQNAWQFPQGGIKRYETPKEALYRELWEEIGVSPKKWNYWLPPRTGCGIAFLKR